MQAHFLPDEARARFAQDRFDAVKRIAGIAAEEECGFVVVAGDVFDSNHVDPQVVARALDALASFTVPVFLLPGNHDPLDASSIYRSEAWSRGKPELVTVVDEITAMPVPGLEGVEVVGCPWRTKHQIGDPAAECYATESPFDGALTVTVAHGVVDELSPEADNPALVDAAGMRKAIEAGRVHYVALGDRHSATEIEGTDARAWYSGAPVATDHGEIEPNQVLLVALGPDSCAVESRAVGAWSFQRRDRQRAVDRSCARRRSLPRGTTFIAADQEGFGPALAEAVSEHRPLAIVYPDGREIVAAPRGGALAFFEHLLTRRGGSKLGQSGIPLPADYRVEFRDRQALAAA